MCMKEKHKKNNFSIGIIVAVVIVIGVFFLVHGHNPNTQVNTQPTQTNTQQNSSGVLFSSSPESSYAYLISTSTLSANAKTALDGFKLTVKKNTDGTTTYTLNSSKQGYPNSNQEYTLKKGEKLYFLERTMHDDNTTSNEDYYLADDTAVVVNSNGYIVPQN